MSRQYWLRTSWIAAVCLASACATLMGCGGSGGLKTVKAKLKVEFEDGQQMPFDASLSFYPEAAGATYVVSSSAVMQVDGEFPLTTTHEQNAIEGAPPGKYKVTVQSGAGAMEDRPGPKEAPECGDKANTPLTVEISDAGVVTPNPLKVPLAKK